MPSRLTMAVPHAIGRCLEPRDVSGEESLHVSGTSHDRSDIWNDSII